MGSIDEPFLSWLLLAARLCLATVFLVSGIHKAIWYGKALQEFRCANAPLAGLTVPMTIGLHLLAPLCLIAGVLVTEASLALAAFTVVATLWVHRFWTMRGAEKLARSRIALAHLAVTGGLLLLAVTGPGRFALG